jgi:hypothetical protein
VGGGGGSGYIGGVSSGTMQSGQRQGHGQVVLPYGSHFTFLFLLGKAPFLLRGPAPGWNKVADAKLCPLPNGRGGDQGEPPQPISAKAKPAALPMTAG